VSDSRLGGTPPHNPYGGPGPAGPDESGENPYGQKPPGQNPYGQNPYGQPPAGQQPYRDPSSGGQPPGQPTDNPYGQPPTGNPYAQPPQPHQAYGSPYAPQLGGPLGDGLDMYGRPLGTDTRPVTVTAAGWITLIFSGLTALLYAILTFAMLVAKDEVLDEINRELVRQDAVGDFNAEDAFGIVLVVLLAFTAWCVIACVLAVFAMRRSNVSRILLVISASVAAVISLLAIGSVISAVWLLACVAVVVLLFTGGAGDWYARRRRY
jgi:hypothetical protein